MCVINSYGCNQLYIVIQLGWIIYLHILHIFAINSYSCTVKLGNMCAFNSYSCTDHEKLIAPLGMGETIQMLGQTTE